jgi:hypothetical protein
VVQAKVFLTVEDALDLAFPDCWHEKRTVFLTEEQQASVGKLAGTPLESAVAIPYTVYCGNSSRPEDPHGENPANASPDGFAYLDTHRVRTLPETILVALDAQGRVKRIEILVFREPEDYIPHEVWYGQFDARGLDERLQLKRDIRGVTGATLTARVTTDAVRRVLALHQILQAPDTGDTSVGDTSVGDTPAGAADSESDTR